MRRVSMNFDEFGCGNFLKLAAVFLLLTGFLAAPSMGQQKGQKTFASAEEAGKALFTAAQGNDEKALLDLLGPEEKEIISSGDEAEDAEARANFLRRYEQMNRLVKEPDGTVTLYLGAHNWPFPIPLVKKGNLWYFDTVAGKKEILFRRIGWNEMSAIRVCGELVAAQKDYYSQYNEYAQKIFSDEGKHNGLYWEAAGNEPQSPIGPLVARAVTDGTLKRPLTDAVPYRGYYFHVLTGQGKNAPGGAKSYVLDGKMTAGFAFVAYPAEYRSSGVKMFVVGADGILYEKDLGKKTETIARAMTQYNPDAAWQKTEQEEQQAASDKPSN